MTKDSMTPEQKAHTNAFQSQMRRGDKFQNEQLYRLHVEEEGSALFGFNHPDRVIPSKQFTKIVSLAEIPDYIKFLSQPFWVWDKIQYPNEMDVPYEEKKWGIYKSVEIEPLTTGESESLTTEESEFLPV